MTTPPADGMPTTRGTNFYLADPNLAFVCATVMGPADLERARPHLTAMGEVAGGELDALAAVADRNPPVLRTHDQTGRRVDEIVRHPAYQAMERIAFERFGLAAMSHREGVLGGPGRIPHVVKYALSYLFSQAEFGLLCPVSLTDSTARILRWFASDALKARYLPLLTSTDVEALWQGAQWMTEKSGGSMRAAGIMRRSVLESIVPARGRGAFGRSLFDLPQLRRDLLEMLLDAEAACSVVLNAAAMLDGADAGSADDRTLIRIVTPLAKYWLTARARVVAGEAMTVRGGNGYIEEWVNARLVRDAHLGAIWEGSSNVVALDVQRAILRAGALEPLAAFLQSRLDEVTEPRAKRWAHVVAAALADLRRRTAAWPALAEADRELDARPVADALYHALAGALLLAEGERLWRDHRSARKLLAGSLYLRKWLRPPAGPASVFTARECAWLTALVDWTPVPAEALAEPAGGG